MRFIERGVGTTHKQTENLTVQRFPRLYPAGPMKWLRPRLDLLFLLVFLGHNGWPIVVIRTCHATTMIVTQCEPTAQSNTDVRLQHACMSHMSHPACKKCVGRHSRTRNTRGEQANCFDIVEGSLFVKQDLILSQCHPAG